MMTKTQSCFILSLSPWPLILSINIFNLLSSVLFFFKIGTLSCLFLSGLCLGCSSFLWWVNYVDEYSKTGFLSFNMEENLKVAMILFISSEIFFFFSFFWTFFDFFLGINMESGLVWPPVGTGLFNCLEVPLVNTLILLTSGVTITISHYFLNLGNKNLMSKFLLITIFLGIFFSLFQGLEYYNSEFSISSNTYGNVFFLLTGFHGTHVIVGFIYLIFSLFMVFMIKSSKSNQVSFELSSWYWHFVDVIWIFVYFFLYFSCEV